MHSQRFRGALYAKKFSTTTNFSLLDEQNQALLLRFTMLVFHETVTKMPKNACSSKHY